MLMQTPAHQHAHERCLPAQTIPARGLAHKAVLSLYEELKLFPKPGLVSMQDSGSHDDMDAELMLRSLFSLRQYFAQCVLAGAQNAGFDALKNAGLGAERRMLRATGGVNTHRGAIFALGLLAASAGACLASGLQLTPAQMQTRLLTHWGEDLDRHAGALGAAHTHGATACRRYTLGGARQEAANGFPSVFGLALPRLQNNLAQGLPVTAAQTDVLFHLIAVSEDTNLYHRGGANGAIFAREQAAAFLQQGGVHTKDWPQRALACHRAFVARRLSPGGAADLFAATWFVHLICAPDLPAQLR